MSRRGLRWAGPSRRTAVPVRRNAVVIVPHTTDQHVATVRANYDARVDQWRTIYSGTSFHDHVIRRRMTYALHAVDRLGPLGQVGSALDGPPPRALDVGCGAGQMALALAERGYDVSAVDVAEGMVAATRQRFADAGRAADIRQADVRALPYGDGEFSWVTALGVIEYLTEPQDAVDEFARVTARGGHVLLTAPNPYRIAFLTDPIGVAMGLLGPPPTGYPRTYLHRWRLKELARTAGLQVIGLLGHGFGPLQVAKRPILPSPVSVRLADAVERTLPPSWLTVTGANLILVARKP